MSRDRKDKTVIGGALGGPGKPNPLPSPGQGARRPPAQGQSTVIGGGLPSGQQPPAPGQPPVAPGGFGQAPPAPGQGFGQTPPPPGQGFGAPQGHAGGGTDPWGNELDSGAADAWGGTPSQTPQAPAAPTPSHGAFAPSDSFFPDQPGAAPQQPMQPVAPQHKIDLRAALRSTGLGAGGPKNPMLAAAAGLLILFGRLRTQMVEMEAVPLMEHVTHEIELFEQNILDAGIDPHEVQVAKYLLCGTADDIVQNIPGTDRHVWIQYSMVARFFNRRTSGVGFFQEVEKALSAPAQRFQLLELALVCLSLGFEGQYRASPDGAVQLQRIRGMIYDSLRRVEPRPDEDISPRWQPVILGGRQRFGGTPLWVIGSVLSVALLGAYLLFSMLINNEGSDVAGKLLDTHPTQTVGLQRATVFTPYVAPPPPETTQLERLREDFASEIGDGQIEVSRRGDFLYFRINNVMLFASGSSDVKPEFKPLAERIAQELNDEPGPIRILGYTDNIPLSGRGRFKNNYELSVARAQSVQAALLPFLADPGRAVVEGKGEADPVADNGTREGRALNRRVEILIAREETL